MQRWTWTGYVSLAALMDAYLQFVLDNQIAPSNFVSFQYSKTGVGDSYEAVLLFWKSNFTPA